VSSAAAVGLRLTREALADALRRRIVPVVAVLAVISLFVVESCTSCSPSATRDGQPIQAAELVGFGAVVGAVLLGLWAMVLAGVLASDHLAEPLADGSAELVLARPVSRGVFALSRLAGAWALAGGTAAILLGAQAALLHVRQGLALAPAGIALLACLAGAATVAALAMTASLWLPRVVTALAVLALVGLLGAVNLAAQLGAELNGFPAWLDAAGPPLATTLLAALAPWVESATPGATSGLALALRSLAWLAGSAGLLVWSFRRIEIGR
jgi:ABC-type transport system involved in multi-copper enzyme maturation permease subunit